MVYRVTKRRDMHSSVLLVTGELPDAFNSENHPDSIDGAEI